MITMSGMQDTSTKAKVLSMLQNERGLASLQGRKGNDSRLSQNRALLGSASKFNGKYSSSIPEGLSYQSTDGTYDNMHFGGG